MSLGTSEVRRHNRPSPIRSGLGLRAWLRRGLIITRHRPSASLGLSHPGGGSEEGRWPGGHLRLVPTSLLGPSRDTCLLWSLSTFHIPLFSSSLPSSTPTLGQASPASFSLLWLWQVDCRSWAEQLSLFGTELDGISLLSPSASHFLPTILPKGDHA